jgi:hypothetical protein
VYEDAREDVIRAIAEVEARRPELSLEEIAAAALAARQLPGPVDPEAVERIALLMSDRSSR